MKKVGIIGWRGMVGSVLRERMEAENDFKLFEPYFFTTSQAGQVAPDYGQPEKKLLDAYTLDDLREMDIILTTQGGEYTEKIHPQLRSHQWNGFWIDAASTLRMKSDSVIVLDPINLKFIEKGIEDNVKDYVGGNCTVSITVMAIGGLLVADEVEWVSAMTYQAASGAGAKAMEELLEQMEHLVRIKNQSPTLDILSLEKKLTESMNSTLPRETIGYPLVGGLLPWIDKALENGQSKEEFKGMSELNKIVGPYNSNPIPVDGTCVRIGSMRCHSLGLTIKLKRDLPLARIEELISQHNPWVRLVPNHKEDTLNELTPVKVSGTLNIPVGRVRKMNLGSTYLNVFTVGDQLLWGAAEPLRRVLRIVLGEKC